MPGCRVHICFTGLEPAVGLCPVLWTVDHTSSITCRYLPSFYSGANYTAWRQASQQLAHNCYTATPRQRSKPATSWSQVWYATTSCHTHSNTAAPFSHELTYYSRHFWRKATISISVTHIPTTPVSISQHADSYEQTAPLPELLHTTHV